MAALTALTALTAARCAAHISAANAPRRRRRRRRRQRRSTPVPCHTAPHAARLPVTEQRTPLTGLRHSGGLYTNKTFTFCDVKRAWLVQVVRFITVVLVVRTKYRRAPRGPRRRVHPLKPYGFTP
eukprot:2806930-Prymnesium_polylepis.2